MKVRSFLADEGDWTTNAAVRPAQVRRLSKTMWLTELKLTWRKA